MPKNKDDIDLDGWNLHRAARENRADIAIALIEKGADVNAKDMQNGTPLHMAAAENSPKVAHLLNEYGAKV